MFGTGKTAIKVSLNRYTQDLSLLANNRAAASAVRTIRARASRSWTDSNGNFYPDCDFVNPAAQNLTATGGDRCGAFTGANANFNLSIPTSVERQEHDGGVEPPRVQLGVLDERPAGDCAAQGGGRRRRIFRRWYGNFTVTDNFAVSATTTARSASSCRSTPGCR